MPLLILLLFSLMSYQTVSGQILESKLSKTYKVDLDLDGKLNENFWNTAEKFSDFKQEYPNLGSNSTEKTEVYLLYDDQNIYIGFKCYQNNNIPIYGSVLERDQSLDVDDYVEVLIDSRSDFSNALSFQTNIFGTRTDTEISDNGSIFNTSFNTYWDAGSSLTGFGWSSEFRIPLSSLRYEKNEINKMRVKFIRHIKNKNETVLYPLNVINIDKPRYNLQSSQEIAFESLPIKRPVYFTPYVINNVSQFSALNNSNNGYSKETQYLTRKNYFNNSDLDKVLSNIGFDLKYKFSNSTTLDLTLNTDFAQAEADDRIINLTRYSILLPEKRGFFLENAQLFNSIMFDHRLFHSRRIGIEKGINVPIIGGVRFVESRENFEYGLMNLQSNGLKNENIEAKNFTVFRTKYNLGGNESYVGVIFTNKTSTETNNFNRLTAIDGFYRFGSNITSSFFAASTFDKGKKPFRNTAYGIRFSRFPQEGFDFDYRFREYQENFNPELAFLPRPNTRRITIRTAYKFYFTNNSFLSRLAIGNYTTYYWISSSNEREFFQTNPYITAVFKDASDILLYFPLHQVDKVFSNWNFTENITIPAGKYTMNVWELTYNSSVANNYNWSLFVSYSNYYGGKKLTLSPSLNYIFGKNFNAELAVDYNRLSFPASYSSTGSAIETQVLYSAKLNYFFSSEFSLKAFLQYDNLSETLGSNLRLSYNPDEGTNLYIVFNQNINTEREKYAPEKPFIDNQNLIIKYSHAFVF